MKLLIRTTLLILMALCANKSLVINASDTLATIIIGEKTFKLPKKTAINAIALLAPHGIPFISNQIQAKKAKQEALKNHIVSLEKRAEERGEKTYQMKEKLLNNQPVVPNFKKLDKYDFAKHIKWLGNAANDENLTYKNLENLKKEIFKCKTAIKLLKAIKERDDLKEEISDDDKIEEVIRLKEKVEKVINLKKIIGQPEKEKEEDKKDYSLLKKWKTTNQNYKKKIDNIKVKTYQSLKNLEPLIKKAAKITKSKKFKKNVPRWKTIFHFFNTPLRYFCGASIGCMSGFLSSLFKGWISGDKGYTKTFACVKECLKDGYYGANIVHQKINNEQEPPKLTNIIKESATNKELLYETTATVANLKLLNIFCGEKNLVLISAAEVVTKKLGTNIAVTVVDKFIKRLAQKITPILENKEALIDIKWEFIETKDKTIKSALENLEKLEKDLEGEEEIALLYLRKRPLKSL